MSNTDSINFDGQVIIITGAGVGLGRAYAQLLAEHGAKIVVNDPGVDVQGHGNDPAAADAVVTEIRVAGGDAIANYDTVATKAGGAAIVQSAIEAYGRVDGLVHNAGILRDKSFLKLDDDDINQVLDVHLKSAFYVGQPVFSAMKQQQHGRMVFTTSASGLFGNFGQANYGSAKTGLVGLMRVLSIEGASKGIRINCVAPSARTRMTEGLLGPLQDQLDPKHVAPLVAFLCSPQCEFTNEIFSAGGGRYARVFLGLTLGWYSSGEVASVDTIAEKMGAIMDTEDFIIPASGMDELAAMLAAFGISMESD